MQDCIIKLHLQNTVHIFVKQISKHYVRVYYFQSNYGTVEQKTLTHNRYLSREKRIEGKLRTSLFKYFHNVPICSW